MPRPEEILARSAGNVAKKPCPPRGITRDLTCRGHAPASLHLSLNTTAVHQPGAVAAAVKGAEDVLFVVLVVAIPLPILAQKRPRSIRAIPVPADSHAEEYAKVFAAALHRYSMFSFAQPWSTSPGQPADGVGRSRRPRRRTRLVNSSVVSAGGCNSGSWHRTVHFPAHRLVSTGWRIAAKGREYSGPAQPRRKGPRMLAAVVGRASDEISAEVSSPPIGGQPCSAGHMGYIASPASCCMPQVVTLASEAPQVCL